MKRCAFLTMANMNDFECYDHLLCQPLANIGWEVTAVPWRSQSVNWGDFEAVIIRSPWDYQQEPERFMSVLEAIDASTARLENSLAIVRDNIDKTYLKDMQAAGIPIVPTLWKNSLPAHSFASWFRDLNAAEVITKPLISANADDTFWLRQPVDEQRRLQLKQAFTDRPFMVQPFIKYIITEGEYSLFYFGGHYSHTILKTPKAGDFRVQEEHGGQLKRVEPEAELRTVSGQTMQALPETPLYARVDFVRTQSNNFALMELELIEPSLYFNMDPESPRRFARRFEQWMDRRL